MKLKLFFVFISILLTTLMGMNFLSANFVVDIHFYLLILLIALDFYQNKKLNLFQVWNCGFIFIILSEMLILLSDEADNIKSYIPSFTYLLMANSLLLTGYLLYKPKLKNVKSNTIIVNTRIYLPFVTLCYVLYFSSTVITILNTILLGRQQSSTMGTTSFWGIFSTALGLILPAIIAYYFRYIKQKQIWLGILLVLPIFFAQLILSTRFHLLFSIVPFFILIGIIDLQKFSWKKNFTLLVFLFLFVSLTSFIKEYRYVSLSEITSLDVIEDEEIEDKKISIKLARKMSPEGVVEMTKLANEYFATHPLSWGKEVSFILYFWVPRSLWPSKPTPIDHWLIRKYYNVSDSHSTASGFTGELRADFGTLSLVFVFIGGFLLKKGDLYITNIFNNGEKSFAIVLAAILFPYVFFLVRSPLTATQSLVFELLIYKLYSYIFVKKISVYK